MGKRFRAPRDGDLFSSLPERFKNNQTVFLRSPFGAGRSGRGARKWGYIDVKRFSVREMGGTDIWPHASPESSAEDDPDDETDVRVPLPRPVAPGERVTMDFEWTSQLPEIVERTGYVHDFHMVGQWFPKIARREPNGAWAHFPFNAQSEFYADFGSYDVTLDVPSDMVVGATGTRLGRRRLRWAKTGSLHGRRRPRLRVDGMARVSRTLRDIDGVHVRHLVSRRETRGTRTSRP